MCRLKIGVNVYANIIFIKCKKKQTNCNFLTTNYRKCFIGKNAPLYVINGVPYSVKSARHKLTSVNSSQIESIVVLKMDQAIARYGNKGENGAILISISKKI